MSLGLTLALDGSTYAGSVALISERDVIAERQLPLVPKPGREGRAEQFMPMVAQCLGDGKAGPRDLARVVCGEGPGSFTSLRVAASIVRSGCSGCAKPKETADTVSRQRTDKRKITLEVVVIRICSSPQD